MLVLTLISYRLFGRRVLPDRSCGPMNKDWRGILRGRCLAGVRVDRNPNVCTSPSS